MILALNRDAPIFQMPKLIGLKQHQLLADKVPACQYCLRWWLLLKVKDTVSSCASQRAQSFAVPVEKQTVSSTMEQRLRSMEEKTLLLHHPKQIRSASCSAWRRTLSSSTLRGKLPATQHGGNCLLLHHPDKLIIGCAGQ